MKVSVEYTAQLRSLLGAGRETYELPSGASVAGLIAAIGARHGAEAAARLESGGSLCFVEGVQAELSEPLDEGAAVIFLSPIAGG